METLREIISNNKKKYSKKLIVDLFIDNISNFDFKQLEDQ